MAHDVDSAFTAAMAAESSDKERPPGTSGSSSNRSGQGHFLDVLTAAEAASVLRVSETDLLKEAESGRVPGRKIGNEWRFLKLSLLEWLHAALRTDPGQPKPIATREQLLAQAGAWKDDETAEQMIEEIYKERKRHPVGG